MNDVVLFKHADMPFQPYGEPQNRSTIAKLVMENLSTTLGAGIATFDGEPISWTVLYDEVIVGISGEFRLGVGEKTYVMGPGDVVWIPANTALRYEGDKATVFYALYPVNWKAAAAAA